MVKDLWEMAAAFYNYLRWEIREEQLEHENSANILCHKPPGGKLLTGTDYYKYLLNHYVQKEENKRAQRKLLLDHPIMKFMIEMANKEGK
jgi:hypothetical protein